MFLDGELKEEERDKPALIFFGRKFSYRQLYEKSEYLRDFLRLNGLAVGDRVMVLLPNCPQMVISYLGINKAGGTMAALNPLLKSDELVEMAKQIKPKFFITLLDFSEHNEALFKVLPPDCKKVIVKMSWALPLWMKPLYLLKTVFKKPSRGDFSWDRLVHWKNMVKWFAEVNVRRSRDADPLAPDPAHHWGNVAVLQFTGGTTGTPKAAMLTNHNLMSNMLQALAMVGDAINKDSIVLGAIPFFHVYGLSVCLNIALFRGATLILTPRFIPVQALKLIEKHKVTLFPGVPRMFSALLQSKEIRLTDFANLHLCVSGSGALNQDVKKEFEALAGCEIIEGYGLSEASPIVSINPHGRAKPGSLGIPVPNTEIRIVPDADAKPEEGGELWISGPQVMTGYLNNSLATEEVFFRERSTGKIWLKTGDMVRWDGEYLVMTDRKKDLIKVRGENIYPSEIEKVLAEHPGIREVSVVGAPDYEHGEKIVACIIKKDGDIPLTEKDVLDFCLEHLGKAKVPQQVSFMDDFPRNFLGKVQKKELRKMFATQKQTPA